MSKTPLLDALETGPWPTFAQEILANTEDIPADIAGAVNRHFWEMAEGEGGAASEGSTKPMEPST